MFYKYVHQEDEGHVGSVWKLSQLSAMSLT